MGSPTARGRRGNTMLMAVLALVVLIGVASLAVDFGRVQLAERELSAAIDAASRYAVTGLSDGTYLAKAQSAAAQNSVAGRPLVLAAADVEPGIWDANAKTFTKTTTNPNALRITGANTAARGTAVPLYFAAVLGKPSFDITEATVARAAADCYEIVGTAGVTVSGNTSIGRASGDAGKLRVASNGTTSVAYGCYVRGDAYYLSTAPSAPGAGVTGNNVRMTKAVALPAITVPANATNAGAINVGSGGATFTGNVACTSLTIGGGGTATMNGDVNFYCSGAVNIGGGGAILDTNNGRATLFLTSTNTATFNMSVPFRMRVYGPQATVTIGGGSPMIGAVMCKTLNVVGSGTLTYVDAASLTDVAGTGCGGSPIAQVR